MKRMTALELCVCVHICIDADESTNEAWQKCQTYIFQLLCFSQRLWRSVTDALMSLTDNPRQLRKQIDRVKSLKAEATSFQQRRAHSNSTPFPVCNCGADRCLNAGGLNNNHENKGATPRVRYIKDKKKIHQTWEQKAEALESNAAQNTFLFFYTHRMIARNPTQAFKIFFGWRNIVFRVPCWRCGTPRIYALRFTESISIQSSHESGRVMMSSW